MASAESALVNEVESQLDEDKLVLPSAWRRFMHPRRDLHSGSSVTISNRAAADVEALWESINPIPARLWANSDADLARECEAARSDPSTATPLGAAGVACALGAALPWRSASRVRMVADAWYATRGPAFMASAAVEMTDLQTMDNVLSAAPADSAIRTEAWDTIMRAREILARVSDAEYAEAIVALSAYRSRRQLIRCVTSYLVPTETAWIDADVNDSHAGEYGNYPLRLSTRSLDQMLLLTEGTPYNIEIGDLGTMIEAVGPGLAPYLAGWFDDQRDWYTDGSRRTLSALAVLPSDEAMALLIERIDIKYVMQALLDACKRFPVRAVRLLAAAANDETPAGRTVQGTLRAHVLAFPEAVDVALAQLDGATAQRVMDLRTGRVEIPVAPADRIPSALIDPPWLRARRRGADAVIVGLAVPDVKELRWLPGEREAWAVAGIEEDTGWNMPSSWEEAAEKLPLGRLSEYHAIQFLLYGDLTLAQAAIPAWTPPERFGHTTGFQRVVARLGIAAYDSAIRLGRAQSTVAAPLLMPFASGDAARLYADWHYRLKSLRPLAKAWMLRHADVAVSTLVPDAVGEPGPARRAAEYALSVLAGAGFTEDILSAAKQYGAPVVDAIEAMLPADALEVLPLTMPTVPGWTEPALFPPIRLRDGSGALPLDAVRHVITMIAMSPPEEPYAGIAVVRDTCEPADLAAFAWALFSEWQRMGYPSKESWALHGVGHFGDDVAVEALSPMIGVWPGEGGHLRAVLGLDVLATIGTNRALTHLSRIAQRAKFKGLKDQAITKMDVLATRIGLTADALADRLVPDLGLDASGSMVLDYGPRQFRVGFDEKLKPYVSDDSGRRKALPKPGVKDDAELAPAAYQRFTRLKKDVRDLARDQVRRFEEAMSSGRRWSGLDFRTYLVEHPLLTHVVRRLVWVWLPEGGSPVGFRVAEDRSFADLDDEAMILPDDAIVGVAHALHLGDAVAAWSELFADYEILQPFAQLGRSTFTLTEAERVARTLDRFTNIDIATTKVLGLERRGWRRGPALDNGIQMWVYRPLADGRAVIANVDPGIAIGMIDTYETQSFKAVWVSATHDGDWNPRGDLTMGTLDAVAISEVIRDLTEVTA